MPLRVGLTHTQIKLARAYEHLEKLKKEVGEYTKHGYSINRQDDPRNEVHRISIKQAVTPDKLGVLPGEFAYSLRSSLDHLAWQLALLTTDTPNDCTAFPICGSKPKPKSRYWKSISNIPQSAADIINDLQPYKRGATFEADLLWQLNRLCNIDKHQVIAFACTTFEVRIDGVTKAWRKDLNDEIVIVIPLAEKEQTKLSVNISGVIFGDPIDKIDGTSGFEIGIDRVEVIYKFVRYEVVPKFERFFAESVAI